MTDSNSQPVGFQPYELGRDTFRRGVELLVPTQLKSQLIEDDKCRREEQEAQEAAARQARFDASEATLADNRPATATNVTMTKAQEALQKEESAWQLIDATDKALLTPATYQVFQSAQALALFKQQGRGGDGDDKERISKIYQELLQRGTTLREIGRPASLQPLEDLAAKQPHMKEVVKFVIDQINLARHSDRPVRLQPMLLVGEAGVGKTHFVQSLAQALATTIHIERMDTDLSNSFLLGSDSKWSNTRHGLLFEQVVLGQHANPVIVLDEIDKSQRSSRYGSPLGALYSVLEPLSAQSVTDISLSFTFDASQVTWIATANEAMLLDQPLRTRLKEFHIMPPTANECLVLAAEVMRSVIESVGVQGFKTDVSLRRHLAHLPARHIQQLTLQAVAHAVADERRELRQGDFPPWLFDGDGEAITVKPNYLH